MTTGAVVAHFCRNASESLSRASIERTIVKRHGWMLPAVGATTAASMSARMSSSETSSLTLKWRTLRRLARTSENSMQHDSFDRWQARTELSEPLTILAEAYPRRRDAPVASRDVAHGVEE